VTNSYETAVVLSSGTSLYPLSTNTFTASQASGYNVLTGGSTYKFAVLATNAAGNSLSSMSGSLMPFAVPGAPTSATATTLLGGVRVSWQYPNNFGSTISTFTVTPQRADLTYETSVVVSSVGGALPLSTNTFTTSQIARYNVLQTGIPYSFAVLATNRAGQSPSTFTNQVTTIGLPSAGGSVSTTLSKAGQPIGTITLDWPAANANGDPNGIGSYIIQPLVSGAPQASLVKILLPGAGTPVPSTFTYATTGLP